MTHVVSEVNAIGSKPISIVCEEDPQEKQFDELIKLWIGNKITYSTLLRNYPDYRMPVIVRMLRKVQRIFEQS